MYKVLSIAKYTFIGNFRNRIFWVLILFGLLLLASSVLFGLLSQQQEIRMLVDLGLASIEILSFLTAVFLTVNLILEEMESRTVYLILTRSIGKMEYLLGKLLGVMTSILVCFLIMVVALLVLLYSKGWQFQKDDGFFVLLSLWMSFEKVFLISSLALFFSLFSSSAVVALAFTFFLWILGHFAVELKFLSYEIKSQTIKWLFKGIYFLIPHFQYLNARDLWITVSDRLPSFILQGSLYTFSYSALVFLLATLTFRRKEF